MKIESWVVRAPTEPMVLASREETAAPGEVLIEVAGCGVCRTDLDVYYDGVPTRSPLPLTLGHEVSGRVVSAGAGAEAWVGLEVVVPAVLPCCECRACQEGHPSSCSRQLFPGNDLHGGFASHLRVPARGLCAVPELEDPAQNPAGLSLCSLAVIADAVSTPYQAILRSGLAPGDVAVFVGAGDVGSFGVQLAAARGAHVIAIDVDEGRLARCAEFGADLTLDASALTSRELRHAVRSFSSARDVPSWRRKVFDTSGTRTGAETAFELLGPGGYLSVIGLAPGKVELRLANLAALGATAQGSWACLPEHYPDIVELALSGAIALEPFIERRPLETINEVFEELHRSDSSRCIVLTP